MVLSKSFFLRGESSLTEAQSKSGVAEVKVNRGDIASYSVGRGVLTA
jgi:hypothetical protein